MFQLIVRARMTFNRRKYYELINNWYAQTKKDDEDAGNGDDYRRMQIFLDIMYIFSSMPNKIKWNMDGLLFYHATTNGMIYVLS